MAEAKDDTEAGAIAPEDRTIPWAPGEVAANIERLFAEAHAAGAGSDPEALPELPPDNEAASASELSLRLMGEAFDRHVDAMMELAEYRRHRRTQ